jgi:putative hydroxymethylpyrimidine transport system substrate-binding protein
VQEGAARLRIDPNAAWKACSVQQTDLATPLNHASWQATVPYFAADPFALDAGRYARFAAFLAATHLIPRAPDVASYTKQIQK